MNYVMLSIQFHSCLRYITIHYITLLYIMAAQLPSRRCQRDRRRPPASRPRPYRSDSTRPASRTSAADFVRASPTHSVDRRRRRTPQPPPIAVTRRRLSRTTRRRRSTTCVRDSSGRQWRRRRRRRRLQGSSPDADRASMAAGKRRRHAGFRSSRGRTRRRHPSCLGEPVP